MRKLPRFFVLGFFTIGIIFFSIHQLSADRRETPSSQGTGLPLPSRGGNPIPTPSPLPSQQLAAQKASKGTTKQKESCLLRSSRKVGSTDIVEIGLEGSGKVIQTLLGTEKESPSDNMELIAGFRYEERVLDWNLNKTNPHLKSIRQYSQAGMKRNFQGIIARPLLDLSRKNMIAEFDGNSILLFSPDGPLKNDQYLLISDLPLNTILLDYFLPGKEVKLGEEWTLPDNILGPVLGLESFEANTVRLVLTAIVDDMAEVDLYLTGNQKDTKGEPIPSTIQGASLGASVSMDIQGKYQFDLKSKRMTWFGLTISERRSESLVEPGLDWKGTIKIRIAPMDKPEELTDDKTKELNAEPTAENLSLAYSGQKGPWKFHHNRDWRMIEDAEKSAALTFVSKGEGIAQCNIMSNGRIDLTSMPTLETYKNELEKGLGEQFGQFVDSSEYYDEQERHILSVVVDGKYDDMPFRRIYYLITDKIGYQITVMYDIAADKLDIFGDSGREIIETISIIPVEPEPKSKEKPQTESEKPAADSEQPPQKPENENSAAEPAPAPSGETPDSSHTESASSEPDSAPK